MTVSAAIWGDLGIQSRGAEANNPLVATDCPNAHRCYLIPTAMTPTSRAHQGWLLPSSLGSRMSFAYLGKASWMLGRSPNPGI